MVSRDTVLCGLKCSRCHARVDTTQAQFKKEEVVPTCVASMRAFARSGRVQEACLGLLRNLCVNGPNAQTTVESGGVGLIVSALVRHRAHLGVQKQASRALGSLASYGS